MHSILIGILALLVILVPCASEVGSQSNDGFMEKFKEARGLHRKARSQDDLRKALNKFQEVLSITESAKADYKIKTAARGLVLVGLTAVYADLYEYEKARVNSEKALELFKSAGLGTGETLSLILLGKAHQKMGDLEKAKTVYEQALQATKTDKAGKGESSVLVNLSGIHERLGEYQKSLEYAERALEAAKRNNDRKSEGNALQHCGVAYKNLGEYQKALAFFERSLNMKLLDDHDGRAASLNQMGLVYDALGQTNRALELHQQALEAYGKKGKKEREATTLNHIGSTYSSMGQPVKALEYFSRALQLDREVRALDSEANTRTKIGQELIRLGQYNKALGHYESAIEIKKRIGGTVAWELNSMAIFYTKLGQWQKALECHEKALTIYQKAGQAGGEATTFCNIASVYKALGEYSKALDYYEKALEIKKKIGVPYEGTEDAKGQVYLRMGDVEKAEPLLKKANRSSSLGSLALAKSDFTDATIQFGKLRHRSTQNRSVDGLLRALTGLGLAYEGLNQHDLAAEHFEKAIALTEQTRDGLPDVLRAKFYDAEIWDVRRITPYEGLARVLAKAGKGADSLKEAEGTKARAFAESLSRRSQNAVLDVPKTIVEQDTDINNRLAALIQGLQKAYEKGSKDAIESFEKQVNELRQEKDRHVRKLRSEYPLFAATKYPQPMELQHTALKDNEWVLEYDVTEPGVCIYLVHGKKIVKALFKPTERKEIEALVRAFREPLEVAPGKDSIADKLKTFDLTAGKKLADLLLGDILPDLPKGAPVIIVPDESLAVLPFEMLVLNTSGEVKTGGKLPSVSGAEFFGDRNAISYYQSVTALTLARTLQKRGKPSDRLFVMADPVFRLNDQRAQAAKGTRIAESDQKFYSQLMASMEDSGSGLRFGRLPLTGELAVNLCGMFKGKSDSLVGLEASKEILLKKVAPNMDRYGSLVFATHGYFNKDNPGFLEPILALTMVPPGTDGFLRMSEVMGLKLNADVVALTACQTGLGRNISGEGTMGMGRAFQYAGAKSVLMSLWNVSEKSSVQLVESFFRHLKAGKSKLEALRLSRQEIRDQGYDHPFFWAPFILVGEAQ